MPLAWPFCQMDLGPFLLEITVALDENPHRKVHWSYFVKPKETKMGPVLLKLGLTIDQA